MHVLAECHQPRRARTSPRFAAHGCGCSAPSGEEIGDQGVDHAAHVSCTTRRSADPEGTFHLVQMLGKHRTDASCSSVSRPERSRHPHRGCCRRSRRPGWRSALPARALVVEKAFAHSRCAACSCEQCLSILRASRNTGSGVERRIASSSNHHAQRLRLCSKPPCSFMQAFASCRHGGGRVRVVRE